MKMYTLTTNFRFLLLLRVVSQVNCYFTNELSCHFGYENIYFHYEFQIFNINKSYDFTSELSVYCYFTTELSLYYHFISELSVYYYFTWNLDTMTIMPYSFPINTIQYTRFPSCFVGGCTSVNPSTQDKSIASNMK